METDNKPALQRGDKVRTAPWPTVGRRFGKEELKQLREALEQNTLFYHHGQKTRLMCAKMAKLCGAKFVTPCSSGSAALHGAVKAAGIGPGDEVITSPITDAGTILGIVYEGAIPVFADVDSASYNITADTICRRLTARTRAVILVHLQGNPADIKPIVKLCRQKKLKLIEDCAQSWGAKVDDQWVGTFGDFGCFSLNDFKHIGCGDGGLIVSNNSKLYHTSWLAIDKCYDRLKGIRVLNFCAPNYRITELQSAVAIAQLDKVKAIAARRNRLAKRLAVGLKKIHGLTPSKTVRGAFSTWWFYLIGYDEEAFNVDASAFCKAVNAEGIPMSVGYVEPVYLAYPYLRNGTAFNHSRWPFDRAKIKPRYGAGLCPVAERMAKECLRFPLNEWLSTKEIDDTLKALAKTARHHSAKKFQK